MAREQQRPDVAARRVSFSSAAALAGAGALVFLDESGAQTHMTRRYGRSEGSSRCVDTAPGGHWKTVTMLTAVRQSGVVKEATVTLEGAINGELFLAWVRQSLVPTLRPGEVVVMDNLSSHKTAGVLEAVEAAGASLWYLPAYSPDLNPIEKLWSKAKAFLCRAGAATTEALGEAVAAALDTVTPQECVNYFASCGYER